MGGGGYFSDVRQARAAVHETRSSEQAFNYHQRAAAGEVHTVHPDLNIFGRIRECCDSAEHPLTTPIVVAMDITASRGNDAKAIYAEVPKMLGVIQTGNLVTDPQMMWAAIGDANSDKAPIQITQFESDRRIDEQLGHIWREEGGGGTGEESYELTAWFLANRCKLDAAKRKVKGFAFFTGDEAPYAKLSAAQLRTHVGPVPGGAELKDVTTLKIFRDLQKLYDTFLIYPRTSMDARLTGIDEEIRKRLIAAGGRFKEVSIRASLIWNDRNDVDLHCLTPGGEHIFFGEKQARCGGYLDVDRNIGGETTKPVENIRWAKGTAQAGRYQFWVETFRFHESPSQAIPYKVELDVNGKIQTFTGELKARKTHEESKQVVFDFVYDPKATEEAKVDDHEAYRDEVVLKKWARYIPDTHILRVQDPASAVETMLGVLALMRGGMTLEQFEESMTKRRVAKERRADVVAALTAFALRGALAEADPELFEE